MPIYGYECTSCHNVFEVMQSIKDDPRTQCELCSGTLKKKIYPVGIAFKGTGFYVNDYSASGPKSASQPAESNGAETTPAPPSAPSEGAPPKVLEPKSESAPAAPAATPAATT